jgi:hypothetical protein
VPAGDSNGMWTHDLFGEANETRSGSLSARTGASGARKNASAAQRKNRLAAAVDRMDVDTTLQQQANVVQPQSQGLTIRGLAGPFTIMAQNFAPGTTLADIESAMTPVGGEIVSSRLVKTDPLIVVELVFASREGGDRVIATFNDKTADGRLIKVYAKPVTGPSSSAAATSKSKPPPTGPKSTRNTSSRIIDGSNGFPDLTATGSGSGGGSDSTGGGKLYSDRMVGGNKRGRGGQRGRGGGGGGGNR